MKRIELEKATASLSDYAKKLSDDGEPIVVTVEGNPIAALLRLENADEESISLSLNPRFVEILERSRESYRKEGGISIEALRKELEAEENADD